MRLLGAISAQACVALKLPRNRRLVHTDLIRKGILNRPQFAGGSKVSMDGAYGKK